jgi:hypothetical protein
MELNTNFIPVPSFYTRYNFSLLSTMNLCVEVNDVDSGAAKKIQYSPSEPAAFVSRAVDAPQIRGSAGDKVQRQEPNILGVRDCDLDLTVREALPRNLSLNEVDLSLE